MGSFGVITLFNGNPDVLVLVGRLLESAGFDVVSALVPDVRKGRCDVNQMMARHNPAVVVYDIGAPYEENWAMFQRLHATAMRDRRFVLTSANPARVEWLAGRDERIYEIVDQPLDLDNIVHAVKEAVRARRIIPGKREPAPDVQRDGDAGTASLGPSAVVVLDVE
jgi:DNA-binding NtrC family response regulator